MGIGDAVIHVLLNGQIIPFYDRAMRIYDPRTSAWASAMVTGEKYVAVGTYAGRCLFVFIMIWLW